MLTGQGYGVDDKRGSGALRLRERFGSVLLDVNMPGRADSGVPGDPPAFGGGHHHATVATARAGGAAAPASDDYITKPRPPELSARMRASGAPVDAG
jgi:DNA-binding response OmpR family regulator